MLVTLIERVGFEAALDNPNAEFTLFAGTNAGYEKIPQNILETLFTNDQFLPHVQSLILYSIFEGARFSPSFMVDEGVITFNGERLRLSPDPPQVNSIPLVDADVAAINGVTHTIDGVVAPSWLFNSLRQRAAADPNLTILSEFLSLTNIDLDTFGDEFTLLAPVDAAFLALGNQTLDALRADVSVLQQVLEYHLLVGIFIGANFFQMPGPFETVEGRDVTFDLDTQQFNNANVLTGDILATNGILFTIDAVLEFPAEARLTGTPVSTSTSAPATAPVPTKTIMDVISDTPDLSTLVTAVIRAQLDEVLGRAGPFTLFGPSDTAFASLPPEVRDQIFTNNEFIPHLRDLLLHHMVPEEYKRLDFSSGLELPTLSTETVVINKVPLRVNGIRIEDADLDAVNGVAHVIADVLTPSWMINTLYDRVAGDDDLSTLKNLAVMANFDLLSSVGAFTLSSVGAFTLLAPTNAAFARIQITVNALMANLEELKTLLEAHVLLGVWTVAELRPGGDFETVAGNTVNVQATPSSVTFGNADLATFGLLATNGLRFKITEVLL
jgi:transforming growth factor-beta-induced protein